MGKIKTNSEESSGRRIAILDDGRRLIGSLKLITQSMVLETNIVELLTLWRNTHRRFFMTQFEATPTRTRQWLSEIVLEDRSRLMFMIADPSGESVGHVGVKRLDEPVIELDNMIRGRSGGGGQLMYWAEVALLNWLFAEREAKAVCLHVFTNNWIPIGIHQSIGFKIVDTYPLVRKEIDGETYYMIGVEGGEIQKFKYAKMVLTDSGFEAFQLRKAGA